MMSGADLIPLIYVNTSDEMSTSGGVRITKDGRAGHSDHSWRVCFLRVHQSQYISTLSYTLLAQGSSRNER